MMANSLSEGAMLTILSDGPVVNPVLQLLGFRRILPSATVSPNPRYRLLISDGVYLNGYTMLATQLNHMIDNNQLAEFSIIRVNRYLTSMLNKSQNRGEKRVIILLDITVLKHGREVGIKIGNPQPVAGIAYGAVVGEGSACGATAAPSPQQPHYPPPALNIASYLAEVEQDLLHLRIQ